MNHAILVEQTEAICQNKYNIDDLLVCKWSLTVVFPALGKVRYCITILVEWLILLGFHERRFIVLS